MVFFLSIIFIISLIGTWIFRKIAIKKSILDIPNHRSSHTIPTPRGGGIAIVIAWFTGLIILFITQQIKAELFYALFSGILLVLISLLDDIYDLKPILRFSAQLISSAFALYFIGGLQIIDLGFFKIENIWILTPIAFISIVWFINLFNFLDGIDGYASTETIFLSLAMFYYTNSSLYILLTASTLGFLIWNWQPAKIFMGDVGSTLLGFNLIILALYFQNSNQISILIFIILSTIFWFDATLTLYRRWRNKEKLTQAHKKHAYQRIIRYGYSHQKTTLLALTVNIILFIISLLSVQTKSYLSGILISIIFIYLIIIIIDKKFSFK